MMAYNAYSVQKALAGRTLVSVPKLKPGTVGANPTNGTIVMPCARCGHFAMNLALNASNHCINCRR